MGDIQVTKENPGPEGGRPGVGVVEGLLGRNSNAQFSELVIPST